MSLRVLTESLTKVPVQEKQHIVTTMREVDERMIASYNKLKTLREKAEAVKAQWKSLQEDIEGVTFARYVTNGTMKEQFQKAIDDLKLEYDDTKATYLHYKELKNKLLTENTVVDSCDDFGFECEDDRPVVIDSETAAITSEEVLDNDNIIHTLVDLLDARSKEDLLDFMFSELVPESGCASTLVGELVRALMHVLYVKRLSSQKFYQDQGLGQCGGAAQFLMDNGYEDAIVSIIDNDDDCAYDNSVMSLIELIARDVVSDNTLLAKANTTDSKSYSNDRIAGLAASFDYTVYLPYYIIEGIDDNKTTYEDVCTYLRNKLGLNASFKCEDPFNDQTAVQFTDITRDLFNTIDDAFTSGNLFDDFKLCDNCTIEAETNTDLFDMQEDEIVVESVEATNISLNEASDMDLQLFLELHEDPKNYENNRYGFDKLYELFDSYGFSSDEDVDVCFNALSEEDKELALQLIRRKD